MPIFVSFNRQGEDFTGYLSLDAVESGEDPELLIKKALRVYNRSISKMRDLLTQMDNTRKKREPLYAKKMWAMGNSIFELKNELSYLSLEIDGMYYHLERDLGVKKKWLEKAIIFRRYIQDKKLIPSSLRWGKCEKSTRKKAEKLAKGLPLE